MTFDRLIVAGNSDWEFMAEIILNLCKVLQILFGNKRDDVRKGLSKIDYSEEEREGDIIPIMILRDNLDVGHTLIKIFTKRNVTEAGEYLKKIMSLREDHFRRGDITLKRFFNNFIEMKKIELSFFSRVSEATIR